MPWLYKMSKILKSCQMKPKGFDVELGKIIFKPKPGLFAEISDGAEYQIHLEEPKADAGEFLVNKEENMNPPRNKLERT